MPYLTIRIKGKDGHYKKELREGSRNIIGRSSDCDISIEAEAVSRQHCVITHNGDTWTMEDMGSSNGTRMNGEKIQGVITLNERDVVKIGKARLTVHIATKAKNFDKTRFTEKTLEEGAAPDTLTCPNCHTWISVAHHLTGDSIKCPRCQTKIIVPLLISASVAETDNEVDEETG